MQVFAAASSAADRSIAVRVSALEVYNGALVDLLAAPAHSSRVHVVHDDLCNTSTVKVRSRLQGYCRADPPCASSGTHVCVCFEHHFAISNHLSHGRHKQARGNFTSKFLTI
jgi:hypothetical protein